MFFFSFIDSIPGVGGGNKEEDGISKEEQVNIMVVFLRARLIYDDTD